MAVRPSIVCMLVGALASLGAQYQTPNFLVEAATPAIAQQVGQYAEYYRREKALQWLGQEMPRWGQPCPLRVSVTMNGSGGATSFAFDRGRILSMDMHIEGTLERLLASVLPHEVTHTVFAHYFRCPVPRWADEGGSVLSEDDIERRRHDGLVRQILNTPGRAIPLRRLFSLTNYPRDVMVLYAEGYSVTDFLVGRSNRAQFLGFVAHGMRGDWDGAVRAYYGINSVEELERAWLQHLRQNRPGAPTQLASAHNRPPTGPTGQVVVRQTFPPAQPLLEAPRPIVRGQAPGDTEDYPVRAAPASPPPAPPVQAAWPAAQQPLSMPPAPVRLGAPQYETAPPAAQGQHVPGSPVGYSP